MKVCARLLFTCLLDLASMSRCWRIGLQTNWRAADDKRDYKPEDYIEHGTTAQSAETVCDYLVNLTNHNDPDSIKAVNYQSIFAMNVKYTQYLQKQIDLLKAEIELLKTKVL